MTRALLNIAELRATALPMSSRPTISTAKDWRTGMSTALTVPMHRASTMRNGIDANPVIATTASVIDRHILIAWVAIRV